MLPATPVRVAAFDGENADPASGRRLEDDLFARTPWGEIAYALAGRSGYERVRESDQQHIAPGADTIRELFGGRPALVLLDELSVYLRKVESIKGARRQLTAFLTSLFKAVESTPRVALVYTLAVGKEGRGVDAYSEENDFLFDQMQEAEKVSARKATLLNPTRQDETIQVIKRRLFESIDESRVSEVVSAYREKWRAHRDALDKDATHPETADLFAASYPFHPEVLETLTSKTATLQNFQRVRGMLRLLARTVGHVWKERPQDATAIHLHHIDPGYEPIRQEIITRLGQSAYLPAITNDVAAESKDRRSLAQQIDAANHKGMPPYAEYVARTTFLHTLAFNDPLKGVRPDRLRYSIVGPGAEIGFVEDARKKFMAESAYLDDRPGAPMRFLAEANLTQIIHQEERHVDAGEARSHLNDRIRTIFDGKVFESIHFPGGPYDVSDEAGESSPKLVVISYDAVSVEGPVNDVPKLVSRIFENKGVDGRELRLYRNNVVFLIADGQRREDMRGKARRRLAMTELRKPERLDRLAEHQQAKVQELADRSELELAVAIQQCYRHVFYPSQNSIGSTAVALAHTAIDSPSSSDKPGAGQKQVVRTLSELGKLRLAGDEPDSPAYVRDRTPLKNKGRMTTRALRDEFRSHVALPILVGNDAFVRGVRMGVEQGTYVYRSGELLYGKGDPAAKIRIDEDSVVMTMAHAKSEDIWPRQTAEEVEGEKEAGGGEESGGGGSGLGEISGEEETGQEGTESGEDESKLERRFKAEAALRDALIQIWEQAQQSRVGAIEELTIRLFDADEGLRLMRIVASQLGAKKTVRLEAGYETSGGACLELEYKGPVEDAGPIEEFLRSEFRAAKTRSLDVQYELVFENGLSVEGKEHGRLTERLTRFVSGSAAVSAKGRKEG